MLWWILGAVLLMALAACCFIGVSRKVSFNGMAISVAGTRLRLIAGLLAIVLALGCFAGCAASLGNNSPPPATNLGAPGDAESDSGASQDASSPTPTPEPDYDVSLAVRMDRADIDREYGDYERWALPSSRTEMAEYRRRLCLALGFKCDEAVSIPMVASQEYFNDLLGWTRGSASSYRVTEISQKELAKQLELWQKAFKDLDADERYQFVIECITNEILRNPVFADALVEALSEHDAVVKANPWLKELQVLFDKAWTARQENGETVVDGAYAFLEIDQAGEGKEDLRPYLRTTDEFFYAVAPLAELIRTRFSPEGVYSLESWKRWPLNMAAQNSDVRTFLQDDPKQQESRPAFIFTHFDKMERVEIRIGFNMADRQVELFQQKQHLTATPPSTPPSTTPSNPKPTPDPDPGSDPTPPPPPKVPDGQGAKDPSADPSNDPTNPDNEGFGVNQPTDGTGTPQPTQPPSNVDRLDADKQAETDQAQKDKEQEKEAGDITGVQGVDPNEPNTPENNTPPPTPPVTETAKPSGGTATTTTQNPNGTTTTTQTPVDNFNTENNNGSVNGFS